MASSAVSVGSLYGSPVRERQAWARSCRNQHGMNWTALPFKDGLRACLIFVAMYAPDTHPRRDLAAHLVVDEGTIRAWESGAIQPIQDHYVALCKVFPSLLGCPPSSSRDWHKPGPDDRAVYRKPLDRNGYFVKACLHHKL